MTASDRSPAGAASFAARRGLLEAPGVQLGRLNGQAIGLVALLAGVLLIGVAPPALGQSSPVGPPLSLAETEALVRSVAYEGLAIEQAARIGADGGARLIELLADPQEKRNHGRILLALGIWGGPGAFEAIEGWRAAALAGGELDRSTFRAWQALPFALGQLASRDARALAQLAGCFEAPVPPFRFGRFSPTALRALERRAAASALVESRAPAAAQILESVAARTRDPELAAHLDAVRAEAGFVRESTP